MTALNVDVPQGTYSQLRVELRTGRIMVVVLPEGLSSDEAAQVTEQLAEIRDIVAGWQPS